MGLLLAPYFRKHSPTMPFFWLLAIFFVFFSNPAYSQPTMDQTGSLRCGSWSFDYFTNHLNGDFCLFEDKNGALRIEAFLGMTRSAETNISAASMDKLLWR